MLVTGANAGIGKELACQLGSRAEVDRVVLACRDRERAEAARRELEQRTGRAIFEVADLDSGDPASARALSAALAVPVDAVVLNAGGTGGSRPEALTASGTTTIFAVNVLGHVALVDALIEQRKLTRVVVMTGSEAARGVPALLIKRPRFARTDEHDLTAAIDGSCFSGRRFDASLAYAQAKYVGALWIGAMARRHPHLRFATVSPGGTAGTRIGQDMPALQRLVFERVVMGPVGARLGLAHPLSVGTARLTTAVLDPSFDGGRFYGSGARSLTGPLVDQATIFGDLAVVAFQDSADAAIHRFLNG
ncbi:SDR family NAD(P)-dependent oxidoreductase [Conexibacter stalactiti]|uniref:SDR family NAD(P)-dependent oxidoreductase n=1 Tax=Conexibacter stalactiti TaxID=1940611 RepID=A0ABU4HRK9_9ACTN|nr:SDR family NAD(P)-dependent oxidoreductase [Conexibacter stalactiti]MDW5595175.1 SDR family NAD(P)-dependent oxidoreductase [Conexibacter stalactiti]MEC5035817.1 SDR family NAD(P)-dependent oxidoreductase [Conexibacter stalactiti]